MLLAFSFSGNKYTWSRVQGRLQIGQWLNLANVTRSYSTVVGLSMTSRVCVYLVRCFVRLWAHGSYLLFRTIRNNVLNVGELNDVF